MMLTVLHMIWTNKDVFVVILIVHTTHDFHPMVSFAQFGPKIICHLIMVPTWSNLYVAISPTWLNWIDHQFNNNFRSLNLWEINQTKHIFSI
jgi:hypothetical protein